MTHLDVTARVAEESFGTPGRASRRVALPAFRVLVDHDVAGRLARRAILAAGHGAGPRRGARGAHESLRVHQRRRDTGMLQSNRMPGSGGGGLAKAVCKCRRPREPDPGECGRCHCLAFPADRLAASILTVPERETLAGGWQISGGQGTEQDRRGSCGRKR